MATNGGRTRKLSVFRTLQLLQPGFRVSTPPFRSFLAETPDPANSWSGVAVRPMLGASRQLEAVRGRPQQASTGPFPSISAQRRSQRLAGLVGGALLSCGGRNALFEVYARRAELSHLKCAFLADRDLWHFTVVPEKYSAVVFTEGYSIENDVLAGDAVERLLSAGESAEFFTLLDRLAEWFAFEVNEWLSGRTPVLDVHVNVLAAPAARALNESWCSTRGFAPAPAALVGAIRSHYRRSLRGKQLLQALLRLLSASARPSKYSRHNLLEIAATSPEHEVFARLCTAIESAFS